MTKPPEIFIGTMCCGEGDFDAHLKSIVEQVGITIIEHKIISDQPEKQAHDLLWSSFTRASSHCDMLTKIDADTVLAHPEVLIRTYEIFVANPRVTSVQSPLHDYFTDGFINGLNSFSPKVKFNAAPELYCDRVDTGHDIQVLAGSVPETLRPAGYHCHHANEVQAFHYGLHRALKNQWPLLRTVEAAHEKHGDRIRLFATLGAEASGAFRDNRGFNYQDERFIKAFKDAERRQHEGD